MSLSPTTTTFAALLLGVTSLGFAPQLLAHPATTLSGTGVDSTALQHVHLRRHDHPPRWFRHYYRHHHKPWWRHGYYDKRMLRKHYRRMHRHHRHHRRHEPAGSYFYFEYRD